MSAFELFSAAQRANGYVEPGTDREPVRPPVAHKAPRRTVAKVAALPWTLQGLGAAHMETMRQRVPVAPPPVPTTNSTTSAGGRRWWRRRALPPSPQSAPPAAHEVLAAAVWPTDTTVTVVGPSGSGKTTAAMLLAQALTTGGTDVLAWEARDQAGDLTTLTGFPGVGLPGLLGPRPPIHSRADFDGFVGRQGPAAVLTSPQPHIDLDAGLVAGLRSLVGAYYPVQVLDTGDAADGVWRFATTAADAVVLTCRADQESVTTALDITATLPAQPAVLAVVLTTWPDTEVSGLVHRLTSAAATCLTLVPVDAAVTTDGPLDLNALSDQSQRAWTTAAARLAKHLAHHQPKETHR